MSMFVPEHVDVKIDTSPDVLKRVDRVLDITERIVKIVERISTPPASVVLPTGELK